MKRPVRKTIRFRLTRGKPPRAPNSCPFCLDQNEECPESLPVRKSTEFHEYEEHWSRDASQKDAPGLIISICAHHWEQFGDLGGLEARQTRFMFRDIFAILGLSFLSVLIPLWVGVPMNSFTMLFATITTGVVLTVVGQF